MYKHSKGKNILQSPCRCFSEMRKSSLGLQEPAVNQDTLKTFSSDPSEELHSVSVPLASFSFQPSSFASYTHNDMLLEIPIF